LSNTLLFACFRESRKRINTAPSTGICTAIPQNEVSTDFKFWQRKWTHVSTSMGGKHDFVSVTKKLFLKS
jgi:hypothetical protein